MLVGHARTRHFSQEVVGVDIEMREHISRLHVAQRDRVLEAAAASSDPEGPLMLRMAAELTCVLTDAYVGRASKLDWLRLGRIDCDDREILAFTGEVEQFKKGRRL